MKTIKDEPIEISNSVNQFLQLKDSLVTTCAWCQQLGNQSFTLHMENSDTKILCSEVCFNQYRRATFKKNKDPKSSKIYSTTKIKSTNDVIIEKRIHHRKLISPYQSSTSVLSRNPSPLFQHPPPSSTHPTNLTSFFLPPPSIDIQYPFFTPSSRQLSLPRVTTTSESFPSTLFSSLTKGLLSNYTCLLPTFIPLPIPIPIPLCLPIHSSCVKCSIDVINAECQTESSNNFLIEQKQTRRMSF